MTEKIVPVAYKLLLSATTKIHPMFHASQLKLCKGEHAQPYVQLSITTTETSPVLQPVSILKSRIIGDQQVRLH